MLERFGQLQYRFANWRVILAVLAVFMVYQAAILPYVSGKLNDYSNHAGVIDLLFAYTPEKLYSILDAYGQDGRSFYIAYSAIGDTVYPIIFTMLFSLLTTVIYRRVFRAGSFMHRLPLFFYAALLFDLIENALIITMAANYPKQLHTLAQISSVFTTAKWASAGLILILLLVGIALLPFKKAKPPISPGH